MRPAARLSLVLVVAVCGLFSAAGPAAAAPTHGMYSRLRTLSRAILLGPLR